MLRNVTVQNDKSMVAIFTCKEVYEFPGRVVADYLKAKIMHEYCLGESHVQVTPSHAVDKKVVEYFVYFSPLAIFVMRSQDDDWLGKIRKWLKIFSTAPSVKEVITESVAEYLLDYEGYYLEEEENPEDCPVKGNWR